MRELFFKLIIDKYVRRADHMPDTALKAEDREDWALTSRSVWPETGSK